MMMTLMMTTMRLMSMMMTLTSCYSFIYFLVLRPAPSPSLLYYVFTPLGATFQIHPSFIRLKWRYGHALSVMSNSAPVMQQDSVQRNKTPKARARRCSPLSLPETKPVEDRKNQDDSKISTQEDTPSEMAEGE